MNLFSIVGLSIVVCTLGFTDATAPDDYDISRAGDGPFTFSISGVEVNAGSSMQRESIVFNDPSCPVAIDGHSTSISYKDRGFRFDGKTSLRVKQAVSAVEIRTSMFDVFGQHMRNLSNTQANDYSDGAVATKAQWRARDNDSSELLTTVTYVARVRLLDGRQWVFNADTLQLALSSLNLENKIEDEATK